MQDAFGQETTPRIVESASATTSPDNVNSGSRAYLAVAIALLVAMALSTSIGGCISSSFKSLYYLAQDDIAATDWDYVLDEDYDLDDYFEEHYTSVGSQA
ncbi:MAG: hypothetical protein IJ092_01305 [Atopobiaceae bacterium]|nr:hypothetical protein [Atopobiaceae bacterium]MBR1828473.1 hypothetical protein [Atopobiaceae bacterium]